jgi:tetratricopeptide (TPR) repeat protein
MLPATAWSLDSRLADFANEAEILARRGDLQGAVQSLEQAVATAGALLGSEHPDVAELVARLALLNLYRNDLDEAESLAQRALDLRKKSFGSAHPAVAASLLDLASIRLVQGRDDEAGEIYRSIVELWTRLAGPEDPRTVQARANLADFLEARGQLAAAQALRDTASPDLPAPSCPSAPATLTPPTWNGELAATLFRIALEHEKRIGHALSRVVHNFSSVPTAATFEALFSVDAEQAHKLASALHREAKGRDPALLSLFALIYAARERLNVVALERLAPSAGAAPDFGALIADVRRRALIGLTRHELSQTPGWAAWIDDATALLARRERIAKLLRPVGFDVNNEIKYRPEFLACVATARPVDTFEYASLRTAAEVIARNSAALDAFLRFVGIDLDAVLKAYARARPGGTKGLEAVSPGVKLDRFNRLVFVNAYPTTLGVHLDSTSRDRVADLAALVSQWEHGGFPRATRMDMENLVLAARRSTDAGPFADLLDAVALDLRTRYPVEQVAASRSDPAWSQPRVARWDRTRVGRDQHHTYYELQFDTHGAFAVPSSEIYLTKRLASPIGIMLAVGLRRLDLPQRALEAFAKQPPLLHLAVLPEPGLTFDLYAHPRTLTRKPGVVPIAFGETPLRPPPASGWELRSFARVTEDAPLEDRVLLDVRPVPGVDPGEAKSFGFHVCLLTPLEVHNEGDLVRFASPIWRDPKDIPASARFAVYRRRPVRGAAWQDFAGRPLSMVPGLDYPDDRVTPLTARVRNGYVELSFTDLTAESGKAYEYRVLHRCALKPHPDGAPENPVQRGSAFEIVAVEHSPERSLRCNVRQGYGGIARPWVRVRYRVRGDSQSPWHDRVSVLDPNGDDLSARNAVTTRRDPPPSPPGAGLEYSLLTSVAACTEGPYQFRIRLEGDGFSQEIAETLYVSVARER